MFVHNSDVSFGVLGTLPYVLDVGLGNGCFRNIKKCAVIVSLWSCIVSLDYTHCCTFILARVALCTMTDRQEGDLGKSDGV